MANDRIYLRHKASKRAILLFKYRGAGEGYVFHDADCLTEWMMEQMADDEGAGATLNGDPLFDLVTESGDETVAWPAGAVKCICCRAQSDKEASNG